MQIKHARRAQAEFLKAFVPTDVCFFLHYGLKWYNGYDWVAADPTFGVMKVLLCQHDQLSMIVVILQWKA